MWIKIKVWQNRFLLAFHILFTKGWKSLWLEIKQFIKQSSVSYEKVDQITEEELNDSRKRLMLILPSMETGGVENVTSILLKHFDRTKIRIELVTIFDRERFYEIPDDVKVHVLERHPRPNFFSYDINLPNKLSRFTVSSSWLEMNALKFSSLVDKRQPFVILAQDYFASIIAALS